MISFLCSKWKDIFNAMGTGNQHLDVYTFKMLKNIKIL